MSVDRQPPDDAHCGDRARPIVRLSNGDGNPMAILSHCFGAARAAGWSDGRIVGFLGEATRGDYMDMLAVVLARFEVQ